ncbi:GNAT family N-acetyltransferase [Chitinimonas sp.]|uniref:GNAT family N-acetyltransferase n=1 Tax=Chitinimonas sp. TaxID=1934313 RepID=UPI0035B052D4
MKPTLTERLLLRAPLDADLPALLEIYGDPATHQYNPAGPLESAEAAGHLLWRWQLHWARHGFGIWVVALRDAPETVIGFGGVAFAGTDSSPRLNLRFRPTAWGQGYASELAQAALQLAFDLRGATEVKAVVAPDNVPARTLLARLGMQETGQVQDYPWLPANLRYSLTAADFVSAQRPGLDASQQMLHQAPRLAA